MSEHHGIVYFVHAKDVASVAFDPDGPPQWLTCDEFGFCRFDGQLPLVPGKYIGSVNGEPHFLWRLLGIPEGMRLRLDLNQPWPLGVRE